MSFRCRQKLVVPCCTPVFDVEPRTEDNGFVAQTLVDQNKDMPDPAMFDLQKQIKAGITQEEVNSKILQSGKIDGAKLVRKYVKKPKENE